jgi:hypothetical protein
MKPGSNEVSPRLKLSRRKVTPHILRRWPLVKEAIICMDLGRGISRTATAL